MTVSFRILIVISLLHIATFVLAIGAERYRSKAKVVADRELVYNYCLYFSSASTLYGLVAFGMLLISQMVVNIVTKCLFFDQGVKRCSLRYLVTIFFFIISWFSFLGAEVCLLVGSIKNAHHTKYRTIYDAITDMSCETLHKGTFAAGAVQSEHLQDEELPMISSI